MKTSELISIFLVACIVIFLQAGNAAERNDAEYADVMSFIKWFCQEEFISSFSQDNARMSAAEYSKKREAVEREQDPTHEGKVVYPTWSPLYIVASYDILHVAIQEGEATVQVAYEQLAKTEGFGTKRRIIPEYLQGNIVLYHLVRKNGRWRILDPPFPRVSIDKMIADYRAEIDFRGSDYLTRPGLSEAQREGFRKFQHDLEILQSLKKGT